jgi:5S rRNA maturation endonuclease (ribonuclease M5)
MDNQYKQNHQELPQRIREWLNDRGIRDEVIDRHFLGWNGRAITIPIFDKDGSFSFFKFRRDPEDINPDTSKYWYKAGSSAELYGWENIRNKRSPIVICEGELDLLVLESNGIPAVTGTGGAGTFKEEWAEQLRAIREIYICLDNDDAGRKGAENIAKLIPHARVIVLPDEVGEEGDITDFFVKCRRTKEEFMQLFSEAKTLEQIGRETEIKIQELEAQNRRYSIKKPSKIVSFEEWKWLIAKNFPELVFPAEVGASVIVQLLIKDITNPFGLVYVDVPSSGKTIVINFFSESEIAYPTDNFTPASFVSQAANVPKKQLEGIDLLPRIRYRALIIRDLAPIFGLRGDDLLKNMSILTRVFDGEGLSLDGGVHGHRGYQGDYLFMFLAASTPISSRIWKLMSSVGSRLYFLSINGKEKDEEELMGQIGNSTVRVKEKECRASTANFIASLWAEHPEGIEWNKSKDQSELLPLIARIAKLLARLRGTVQVWEKRGTEEYEHEPPIIEKPDRISQNLYNLARGHAVVRGDCSINWEDISVVLRVALDSASPSRVKLFKLLLEHGGKLKSSTIMEALRCSRQVALKNMKMLEALNLVTYDLKLGGDRSSSQEEQKGTDYIIKLRPDLKWFLNDECQLLRAGKSHEEQNKTQGQINLIKSI